MRLPPLAMILPACCALAVLPVTAQVYVDQSTNYRIGISHDGNAVDTDDILATPVAMALICEAGLKGQLTHVSYNNNLGENDPALASAMKTSVTGAATRWGISSSVVFNVLENRQGAIDSIAAQINASSANNRFILAAAGPMELIWRGIQAAQSSKRQFCTVVSHGGWNETYFNSPNSTHTWPDIETSGVKAIEITSQNFNYNKDYADWTWLRDSSNPDWQWLWTRGDAAGKATFDCSDAGMAFWLVTGQGNIKGTPAQTRAIFEGNFIPAGNTKVGLLSADASFTPTSTSASPNDSDTLKTTGANMIVLRFKVNPADVGSISNATIKLFEQTANDTAARNAVLYGLPDEGLNYNETGEMFTEMETYGTNFDYTKGGSLNTGALTALGSVSYNAATSDVLSLSTSALANFLNADTNGVVTFVIDYTGATTFHQKESDSSKPAALTWQTSTATNLPPVSNAGSDQTVTDSNGDDYESVTLNGAGSSDDGTITSYVWTANSATIATGKTPVVNFAVGTHTVTLTVTDDGGKTASDTVVISVKAPTSSGLLTISAENYEIDSDGDPASSGVGIRVVSSSAAIGGAKVGYTSNGAWTKYASVDFDGGATSIEVVASSLSTGGRLAFRLGSPTGLTIAEVTVPVTGGWNTFQTITSPVTGDTAGVHDVYMVVVSAGIDIDEFRFVTGSTQSSDLYLANFEGGTQNYSNLVLTSVDGTGAGEGQVPATGSLYAWDTLASAIPLPAGITNLKLNADVKLPSAELGDVRFEVIVVFNQSTGSPSKVMGGRLSVDSNFVGKWATYEDTVAIPAGAVSISSVRIKFVQLNSSAGANTVYVDNIRVRQ